MTCTQKKVYRIHASNYDIPLPIDLDFPFWRDPATGAIVPVDLTNPPLGPGEFLGIRVISRDPLGTERQDESWEAGTGITIHGPRRIHITFPSELFDAAVPGPYSLVVEVLRYIPSTPPYILACWEADLDTCIEVYTTGKCPPSEGG